MELKGREGPGTREGQGSEGKAGKRGKGREARERHFFFLAKNNVEWNGTEYNTIQWNGME